MPCGPVERALALAAPRRRRTRTPLARLPLGRRDARLLALRAALSGPALEATATCPALRRGGRVRARRRRAARPRRRGASAPEPVEVGGRRVTWRPPDSRDVAARRAGEARTSSACCSTRVLLERLRRRRRRALPTRCASAVDGCDGRGGSARRGAGRPRVSRLREPFVADVDVGAFVWAEVRARALRLLQEVDALARAYGWTEAEVLALGERGAAAYLELAARGRMSDFLSRLAARAVGARAGRAAAAGAASSGSAAPAGCARGRRRRPAPPRSCARRRAGTPRPRRRACRDAPRDATPRPGAEPMPPAGPPRRPKPSRGRPERERARPERGAAVASRRASGEPAWHRRRTPSPQQRGARASRPPQPVAAVARSCRHVARPRLQPSALRRDRGRRRAAGPRPHRPPRRAREPRAAAAAAAARAPNGRAPRAVARGLPARQAGGR